MSDKKGEKQKLREKWQFYGLLFSLNIGGVMFLVIAIFQYFELKDAFLNPVELGQFCFYFTEFVYYLLCFVSLLWYVFSLVTSTNKCNTKYCKLYD